eukprot:TRINITY_DN1248_c0_g1_i1.p1 TRINITY_DN1248_c0_g1~~TRINITY_DN1248_c0_g1_i1.p1  ORF type:complete len:508 (+),score=206.28 TRINITY_DN1248_c0_g1_i1:67-1590(+)
MLPMLASASLAAQPNLLLLFPDQWRYDWDGLTPSINTGELPLKVPVMHKLAAKGTRFKQSYVPAPVCAPSRSCLAAGREYDEAGVLDNFNNDYPVDQPTFYKLLRDQGGYHTMTTGKDDLTKATRMGTTVHYKGCPQCKDGDGLFHQEELGFSDGMRHSGKMDVVYTPEPAEMYGYYLRNQTLPHGITAWDSHRACFGKGDKSLCRNDTFYGELYEDNWVASNAVKLLNRAPKDKPWFLHVSFPGPHSPFLVTADMHNSVSHGRVWPPATDSKDPVGPEVCKAGKNPSSGSSRCNYAAEIENLDALFAKVLSAVDDLGHRNNTIVCVTSDHGEMLGDHDDGGKSKPWQGSAAVPFVCSGPGIREGVEIERPVGTMDLAATFLDYAGVKPAEGMTSVSLKSMLTEGANGQYRNHVSSGLDAWRMVVQDGTSDDGKTTTSFKYICCKGNCVGKPSTAPSAVNGWTEMLIDVHADPFDMHDLAPENPKLGKQMAAMLPKKYAAGCGQFHQ